MLRTQLGLVNDENKRLLDTILDFVKPEAIQQSATPIEPIKPKAVAWRIRQGLLEQEDRQKARILKEMESNPIKIDDLERELGVDDASQIS